MKINWKNEEERLICLINNNTAYEEIGRLYGVSGQAIKKAAKRLGIQLCPKRKINPQEHFNKGVKRIVRVCLNCGKKINRMGTTQKFCSLKCTQEYRYKQRVQDWLSNPEKYNNESTYSFIRKYMFIKHNSKCEKCGWGEKNKNTGSVPLQIHHIDGNCTNNIESNLQLLCPNCHSLTETFGAKNKNSKRYKLKTYKEDLSNERLVKYIETLDNDRKKRILEKLND